MADKNFNIPEEWALVPMEGESQEGAIGVETQETADYVSPAYIESTIQSVVASRAAEVPTPADLSKIAGLEDLLEMAAAAGAAAEAQDEAMTNARNRAEEMDISHGQALNRDALQNEQANFDKGELYIDLMAHSRSIRDLLSGISRLGEIVAPDGYVYKKDELIPLIGNLKGPDDPNLDRVTRTHGLRDKVRELLSMS